MSYLTCIAFALFKLIETRNMASDWDMKRPPHDAELEKLINEGLKYEYFMQDNDFASETDDHCEQEKTCSTASEKDLDAALEHYPDIQEEGGTKVQENEFQYDNQSEDEDNISLSRLINIIVPSRLQLRGKNGKK